MLDAEYRRLMEAYAAAELDRLRDAPACRCQQVSDLHAMDNRQGFTREQILSHLGHRPSYIIWDLIRVDEDSRPPVLFTEPDRESSIGTLSDLPLEILHITLGYLDLQSLSCLSRVSAAGRAVVLSLPQFSHLLSYAGHVFSALSRTRTIGLHSVTTLNTLLHSDRCRSYGKNGAFLHILLAERCCHACLLGQPIPLGNSSEAGGRIFRLDQAGYQDSTRSAKYPRQILRRIHCRSEGVT